MNDSSHSTIKGKHRQKKNIGESEQKGSIHIVDDPSK